MKALDHSTAVAWCEEGDLRSVTAWLKGNNQGEDKEGAATTLLHCAAQRGHTEIIRLLLEEHADLVNVKDHESGDTALHAAARGNHEGAFQQLLELGADLGIPNKEEETPMSLIGNISADVLEEILDNCIVGKREGSNFMLTLIYPFLSTSGQCAAREKEADLTNVVSTSKEEGSKDTVSMKQICSDNKHMEERSTEALPETTRLLFMTQSKEHIHLLEHPSITSFLHMKWKTIEPYFIIKLACCVIFMAFLNAYVFLLNQNIEKEGGEKHKETKAESVIRWTTFVLLIILTFRELLLTTLPLIVKLLQNIRGLAREKLSYASLKQAFQPLMIYMTGRDSLENFLRLMLIISTYLLMFLPWEKIRVQHLSAVTVLLSWVYALFFWANHPWAAVYGTMVTTISKNFFKVLLWLFWFAFAFALTFFFLFHTTEEDEEGNQTNESFNCADEAILKTIIMVFTGEVDFGGIVFSAPFGKFIFVLFVFFIMLVLMNLLNGLAISDIALIQKESEINTQIARMNVISDYESIFVNSPFFRTYGGFSLVSEKLKEKEAVFKLKKGIWIGVNPDNFDLVPKPMLDAAKALSVSKRLIPAEEKLKQADTEKFAVKELQERLKKIELTLEKMSEKLTKLK